MFVKELDNFVRKFHQLWKAGATAHLGVDTHAGRAWVGLRVHLGQVPAGPGHHPPHRQRGPAYQRRQERRKAARASPTADQSSSEILDDDVEAEQAKAENQDKQKNIEAEKANIEETSANENSEATISNTAVEAVEANTCDLCDKSFGTLKGLSAHIGHQHKTIPQVDGHSDLINEPTYCKVCKDCPNEIQTSEDINFHVMNDHEVNAVIENYGEEWASDRRYCIQRWSPFENWFKTP